MSSHPGVNLIGYAQSVNGLGISARMVADILLREGVPLNILPIPLPAHRDAADADLAPYRPYFGTEPVHPINLFVFGGDFGRLGYAKFRVPLKMDERFNAILPFWELAAYPDAFLGLRNAFQLFLAGSRFIQVGLMHQLPRAHVDYLPTAAITLPPAAERCADASRPFRFFFNFDIMSSVDRKQPGSLIQAYKQLFADDPSTELVMKVSGTGHSSAPRVLERLAQLADGAPGVKFVTEVLPRPQMLQLIGEADAYVSCHRTEGLGMGLLEAMAMGVPCIATGYGGNTDFMNRGNSILLRYEFEDVKCPMYMKLVGKPARWPRPAWGDLSRAMTAVRHDAQLRERLSANGKRDALRYIDASWNCGLGSLLHEAWRQSAAHKAA